MEQQENLRKVQLLEYELLEKFRQICEAEGLKYYLVGGTLLGAVRHKGFIPWDNDVDVGMLRPDYDRFVSVAGKYLEKGQAIRHYTLDKDYHAYTMKLVNENAAFVMQREFSTVRNNIWIDIFPLDGTPENAFFRKLHFLRMDMLRMKLAFHYIDQVRFDEERSRFKKLLVTFARRVPIGRLIDPTRVKRAMDKELRRHDVATAKYIGNHTVPDHVIALFPADGYGEGREMTFEAGKFCAPVKTEEFLRIKYGDYMKLPPENKRVPKHNIIRIEFTKSEEEGS